MCTLRELLKRDNYHFKIDADFFGGRGWGGKLLGDGGLSGDPNTNFALNAQSLDDVLVQVSPHYLYFGIIIVSRKSLASHEV